MTERAVAVEVAGIVALAVACGAAMDGIVDGHATLAVAAITSVAAAIIAIALDARRARRLTFGGVVVAGAAIAGLVTTLTAPDRTDPVLNAFGDAVVHGWATVVRSPVPADAEPRMLVPLALLTWSATFASVLAARRARAAVVALLPVLTAFVLASVAAGREQVHPLALGVAVLAASATVVVAHHHRTSAADRGSSQRAALATIALGAAAVGVAAGPLLTLGRDAAPFDARDRWDPPTVPQDMLGPLDMVDARRRVPDEPMFEVAADEPVTTRLAAYDHFDGTTWSVSGSYRRSGEVLPEQPAVDAPTEDVEATITITGLDGAWLPTAGVTRRIAGAPIYVEPLSLSVIAAGGDVAGLTYTVDATVPRPDLTEFQDADAAADPAASAALQTAAGLPADLRTMAETATAGADTPLAKAALLELYLRRNFRVDEARASGFSYGHLLRALTVSGSGTPAQFAAAFAVLGRVVGLPTRVVVGFGPGTETADGRYEVTAGDVAVWPEVAIDGAGWVAFDPVPSDLGNSGGGDGTVSVGIGPPRDDIAESPRDPDEAASSDDRDDPAAPDAGDDRSGGGVAWGRVGLAAGGVVLAVAIVGPMAIWLAKRVRSARRRRGDAHERVVGAWHDVLDRLVEDGVDEPQRYTVDELVGREPAASALIGMRRPVQQALYADLPVSAADAEQAWRARDRYVAARRRRTRRQRLRCSIDPRPLRRRTGMAEVEQ